LAFVIGVGHKVKPVAPMWRADTRSRKYHRPNRVSDLFQVILNLVEPATWVFRSDAFNCCTNLLAKDRDRAALRNEAGEVWPEMPLVVESVPAAAGTAEGLAGTRASPHRLVVGPTRKTQGVGPAADASEEVTLLEAAEVSWFDALDWPLIDHTLWNHAFRHALPQTRRCEAISFVVVDHAFLTFNS
jgi:hypothetical protein